MYDSIWPLSVPRYLECEFFNPVVRMKTRHFIFRLAGGGARRGLKAEYDSPAPPPASPPRPKWHGVILEARRTPARMEFRSSAWSILSLEFLVSSHNDRCAESAMFLPLSTDDRLAVYRSVRGGETRKGVAPV